MSNKANTAAFANQGWLMVFAGAAIDYLSYPSLNFIQYKSWSSVLEGNGACVFCRPTVFTSNITGRPVNSTKKDMYVY